MKIITFFSQAGGVGKTTLCMTVGHLLAERGKGKGKGNRVLLVDADPQASLTTFSGYLPEEMEQTLTDVLLDGVDPFTVMLDGLRSEDSPVGLIPSNLHLAVAEQAIANMDLRDFAFKRALTPLEDAFDYCLIDCPPSLGMLSYTALVASSGVVVPVQTQHKSLETLNAFAETFKRIKRGANPGLEVVAIVPTLFNRSYGHDKEVLAELKASGLPCLTPIPRATIVADASRACLPLHRMKGVPKALLSTFEEVADAVANH